MNNFNLTIISLKEILYDGSAVSVSVPGAEGELTVLKNHIPLITLLKAGQIKVKVNNVEDIDEGNEEQLFNVQKGILEVNQNRTTILVS